MIPKRQVPTLIIAASFFLLASVLNNKIQKPPIVISKQQSAFNFSKNLIRIGFAGYKRLVADTLWIATLLESDLEHYKRKDLNSWMYLRFKTIAGLDPNFRQNYVFGGRYLSIVKDDIVGGNKLMEEGLTNFPEEKILLESLAFNYAFELRDYQSAIKYYQKLAESPDSPPFYSSILLKLKHKENPNLSQTIKQVRQLLSQTPKEDTVFRVKLETDLKNLIIQRDLECLNEGRENNCNTKTPDGHPYIRGPKGYLPPEGFQHYKLYYRQETK